MGTPSMIASTWTDYIAIATRLATSYHEASTVSTAASSSTRHHGEYMSLRYQIESQRWTSPLFDAQLWANHWSLAMKHIWQQHCRSIPPCDIDVSRLS
jgi:predicted O-linked N-acetylglucosamine transferase (SPINDLY family)